ncbi:MAG: insulinase family protein [SAR202 cluster bacterium]|nr:Zn-dependent peptidase [Chloroflexota bacterium]MDP6497246.1 pitrilysin family protein [Dehalococcoidia bacterium]MQG10233.1 insulinase family protein [SAR202 cluster bacterium]MQG54972.1 insulinase family protein [SAR202 cluster bacterium]
MVTIAFEKHTLSNGLDVILHEDHTIPVVAVNVWYHVGSKDEEMGRTGFAHLFEHVMFEGSKHHNSSHFEPLQKAGANLNGSTTPDRTNYWEDVPTNYLDLALWLEADRMGFLLDALDQQRLDIQRDVVKNERRQSYENRPYGMAHWHLQEALYPLPHPYNWMTIGSQEDLDAATLDDIKAFFTRFYTPTNASLAIAGDIDMGEALEMANKYFSNLAPGEAVPRKGRHDSGLKGRIELEMRDKVTLPRTYIAWPTSPEGDVDDAPLEIYQAIMSDGLTSRLHKSLVYEKQIAQNANMRYHSSEISGQCVMSVTAAEGHELAEVEAAADAEMARLLREPPTDEEITRVKNRIEASHFRSLARIGGFGGRADQLNHFSVFSANPELINTSLDKYMKVTREDIIRVAETVLGGNQVRLRVLPEPSLSPATVTIDRTIMPEPKAEPVFNPPTPTRTTLSNGMGISVIEQRGLPIVAFGMLMDAGASRDPEQLPGLAGFTAQMLPEGTTSKNSQEIAQAFEFIGSRISAEGRREYTLLSAETLTKHWPTALELTADLVLNPSFPDHEVERVRREHLTELRRGKDEPNAVAEQLMAGLVFQRDSGYGHPLSGTENSIGALTRDDMVRQFSQDYNPANANLIVVGDVSIDEVAKRAEEIFGSWKGGDSSANGVATIAPSNGTATIYLVDRPGAPQSVIRAMHTTIPRLHPDYLGLTLMNYAFGGQFSARLNQNLRQEKGYSYGYQSHVQWFRGPSLMLAGGSVQTEVTKESVFETLKEFNEVRGSRPISAEELDNSKQSVLRSFPANFERPGAIMGQVLQMVQFGLPDDYLQTVRSNVEAVTLDEVHRVTQELVRPDQLKILVVGDRQQIEKGLRELDIPTVILDVDGVETT